MKRRRSDVNYWPVFGDVALSMLLVFVLFILVQFLHYERIFILDELRRRQALVRDELLAGLTDEFRSSVAIQDLDDYRQRVTFASDVLFASCRTELQSRGAALVVEVGHLLRRRADFFLSVQIEGHTDVRNPVGPPLCPVRDNWELSSQRATRVLRMLADSAVGFPGALLSAVGRGSHHPVDLADFDRNRRIEVVLQYTDANILLSAGAR